MTTQTHTTLYFIITGMTCGGCVNTVTNLLKSQTGVHDVSIDLATGLATVELNNNVDSTITTTITDILRQSIEDIGFECIVPSSQHVNTLLKQVEHAAQQDNNNSIEDDATNLINTIYPSLGI